MKNVVLTLIRLAYIQNCREIHTLYLMGLVLKHILYLIIHSYFISTSYTWYMYMIFYIYILYMIYVYDIFVWKWI